MNSGNFGIFYTESIIILNGLACRALKIISNDIKIGTIPWDFKVENPRFNFCVGENVGGQLATNFLNKSKDALENSASFDTSIVTESRRGIIVTLHV